MEVGDRISDFRVSGGPPLLCLLADGYLRLETTSMDPLGFKVCLILAAQVLRRRWRHFTTALCHFLFSNSSLSLLQILQECHFDDNKKIEVKASV